MQRLSLSSPLVLLEVLLHLLFKVIIVELFLEDAPIASLEDRALRRKLIQFVCFFTQQQDFFADAVAVLITENVFGACQNQVVLLYRCLSWHVRYSHKVEQFPNIVNVEARVPATS